MKKLQDLLFKDNFMFATVMLDPENCRLVLERILGISIERVEVDKERNMAYNPQQKGVRLDVYAKSPDNRHFDVEMQVASDAVAKRSRYYHAHMDMELLSSGTEYKELPESYVIFICDFDPFKLGKYRYTRVMHFKEDGSFEYDDGTHTVFLSTKGSNDDEEPRELVSFMKFIGADAGHDEDDYRDELVTKLQKSIADIKSSREAGERYMMYREILAEQYNAGKAEGIQQGVQKGKVDAIIKLLEENGDVSDRIRGILCQVTDLEKLNKLLKTAAHADSVEKFEEEMSKLLS